MPTNLLLGITVQKTSNSLWRITHCFNLSSIISVDGYRPLNKGFKVKHSLEFTLVGLYKKCWMVALSVKMNLG